MNKVIIPIIVGVGAALILAFLVKNSTPQWSVKDNSLKALFPKTILPDNR